uniref:Ion_trans domain-containing protein n=1 Tax=Angiostrongylus cantonensis TaxID=6313 RepID=A0A0K0CUB8_ANGCA
MTTIRASSYAIIMDEDMIEIPQNDDLSPAKHPCSKFLVRIVTVITCLHMILRRRTTAMEDELLRCRTFSFILTCVPNSELDNFADLDGKDLYMFMESVFESFSFIYSISNAHSSLTAPWSSYLLSSLYTLILWFFFLNFIVNIQLAELDCRIAREIAAAIVDVNDDDVRDAVPN